MPFFIIASKRGQIALIKDDRKPTGERLSLLKSNELKNTGEKVVINKFFKGGNTESECVKLWDNHRAFTSLSEKQRESGEDEEFSEKLRRASRRALTVYGGTLLMIASLNKENLEFVKKYYNSDASAEMFTESLKIKRAVLNDEIPEYSSYLFEIQDVFEALSRESLENLEPHVKSRDFSRPLLRKNLKAKLGKVAENFKNKLY